MMYPIIVTFPSFGVLVPTHPARGSNFKNSIIEQKSLKIIATNRIKIFAMAYQLRGGGEVQVTFQSPCVGIELNLVILRKIKSSLSYKSESDTMFKTS